MGNPVYDADGNPVIVPGSGGATKNFTLEQIRRYVLEGADDEDDDGEFEDNLRYETLTVNGGVNTNLNGYAVNVISGPGIKSLPSDPRDGEWVKIIDLTNRNQLVMLNAGTRRFMNDERPGNNTLILNSGSVSFELVYIGKQAGGGASEDVADHVGWVIIGAQTLD